MNNVVGRPVDLQKADTVAVPANPGATHKTKMYSTKEYTESQLADGLDKFDDSVSELEEGDFLTADTNKFLFNNKARASLERLLRRGFKILYITWNYEGVLLAHPAKRISIWLHIPLCKGAPGQPRHIESVVLRNMTIQLSTMIAAWCLGENRGRMNDSFHDATLAAYACEHALIGCHMYAMQGAACQLDVFTAPSVFALLQNDLSRARDSGIYHPIAKNIRQKISRAAVACRTGNDNNPSKEINHLALIRVFNLILLADTTAKKKKSVKKIIKKKSLKKTVRTRRRSVQDLFIIESPSFRVRKC